MWFGTYNGLNRYDGYQFQGPISLRRTTQTAWEESSSTVLFKDQSGVLWIGVDEGLDRFDPVTQTFTHFRSSRRSREPGWTPGAHSPGQRRNVVARHAQQTAMISWIRFQVSSLTIATIQTIPTVWAATIFDTCSRTGRAHSQVPTAAGPDAFDDRRDGESHSPLSFSKFSPDPPSTGYFEDRSGTLWLSVTRRGGLTSLDPKTGVFAAYIFF